MAYLGQLRVEVAGPVHGWACDWCGTKAETSSGPPPQWYADQKYSVTIQPLTFASSPLFCTKRCATKATTVDRKHHPNQEEIEAIVESIAHAQGVGSLLQIDGVWDLVLQKYHRAAVADLRLYDWQKKQRQKQKQPGL